MLVPTLLSEIPTLLDQMVYYQVPGENKIERGQITKVSYEATNESDPTRRLKTEMVLMATIFKLNNRIHGYTLPVTDIYSSLEELVSNLKVQAIDDMVANYHKSNHPV